MPDAFESAPTGDIGIPIGMPIFVSAFMVVESADDNHYKSMDPDWVKCSFRIR